MTPVLKLRSNSSMTPVGSDVGVYYHTLQIQSSAPEDGRKHRPKYVELTRNNKFTYIVASRWLYSKLMCRNNIGKLAMCLPVAQTATTFARYSTNYFGDSFCIIKENRSLISTISVLPSDNAALYHMFNAHLFLQPHIIS
jgi:hypothetical protein